MNTEAKLVISDDVVHTEVEQHTMLMSIELGKYYSLSPVGTRIWQLLEEPQSISQLLEQLQEEFDVSEDECRKDLTFVLEQLEERLLLRRA
jgi:hypothetical protein